MKRIYIIGGLIVALYFVSSNWRPVPRPSPSLSPSPAITQPAVISSTPLPYRITQKMPQFEEYPVAPENMFTGTPMPVIFEGQYALHAPGDIGYQEILTRNFFQGVMFAGRYSIAIWGCGIQCHRVALVDLSTGKVISVEAYWAVDIWYKKDSRLLVINPLNKVAEFTANIGEAFVNTQTEYYELRDGHLYLLGRFEITDGVVRQIK